MEGEQYGTDALQSGERTLNTDRRNFGNANRIEKSASQQKTTTECRCGRTQLGFSIRLLDPPF
jgi:hypothetical protein